MGRRTHVGARRTRGGCVTGVTRTRRSGGHGSGRPSGTTPGATSPSPTTARPGRAGTDSTPSRTSSPVRDGPSWTGGDVTRSSSGRRGGTRSTSAGRGTSRTPTFSSTILGPVRPLGCALGSGPTTWHRGVRRDFEPSLFGAAAPSPGPRSSRPRATEVPLRFRWTYRRAPRPSGPHRHPGERRDRRGPPVRSDPPVYSGLGDGGRGDGGRGRRWDPFQRPTTAQTHTDNKTYTDIDNKKHTLTHTDTH